MSAPDVLARLAADVHRVVARAGGEAVVAARREVTARSPLLNPDEREQVVSRVVARVHGLGVLEPLLADPEVSEGRNLKWARAMRYC